MQKQLLAGAALVLSAMLVMGCSSPMKNLPKEDPRVQQERQDRMQRDHRSATERLDKQVD
ncbi:hypothetical protein [Marinospirillum sp.]|uniref:hypothetical protein n=1 Tax=Marinospirillum sp. TaxID=2183934 RepID=UPI00384E502A